MRFFIPGIPDHEAVAAYDALSLSAHDQLRTSITPKRIYSLKYIHDKHPITVRVGESHPDHTRYNIIAIFESQPHIVITQTAAGQPGPTIMVASHEITEIVEFTP